MASPMLDRSPSLSSDSGTSSVATLPTPALPPTSSFPSSVYPHKADDHHDDEYATPATVNHYTSHTTTPRSSNTRTTTKPSSPWSTGHRATVSFDNAREIFSNSETSSFNRSPSSAKTSLLNQQAPQDAEKIASWRAKAVNNNSSSRSPTRSSSSSVNTPDVTSASSNKILSPLGAITMGGTSPSTQAPRSPTRFGSTLRSPTTPTRTLESPFVNRNSPATFSRHPPSPTRQRTLSNSPTRMTTHVTSPVTNLNSPSQRELSSAIFASRGLDDSNSIIVAEREDIVGSTPVMTTGLKRFDSVSSVGGRTAMGHRRAMTLPVNSLTQEGLPSPIAEEVAGLPGRARLSRPAEAPSSFAPSAVFSSSHGLSRQAAGSSTTRQNSGRSTSPSKLLLPSQTVKAIDQQRQNLVAYEYLCHVRETQEWLDSCITTRPQDAPPMWSDAANDFEQSLRNGYALAHLARSLGGPNCQGPIYNDPVRHFRHTDNINIFLTFIDEVGLPRIFHFETVDLYDGKNLPKVIYCLHALSHLLYRRGVAQRMNDLVGQVEFTDAEMRATEKGLDGVRMPNFRGIGQALDKHSSMKSQSPPPETEQQLQQRLLIECQQDIVEMQAVARGFLCKLKVKEMKRIRDQLERQRRVAEEEKRQKFEAEQRKQKLEEMQRQEQERQRIEFEKREQEKREHEARLKAQRDHEQAVQHASRVLVGLQAHARGSLSRQALLDKIRLMRTNETFIVQVQATCRGHLTRQRHQAKANHLRKAEVVRSFGKLTSLARAALVRKKVDVQKQNLGFVEPDVVGLQAQLRGWSARTSFLAWRDNVYRNEDVVVYLQSLCRGALVRNKFDMMKWQMHSNMDAIVKLQALIRSRQQRLDYLQLRTGTNVPVSTIKNFARLLDDSEHDYRGQVLVESLRKQLVSNVRETQDLEDDVRDLDTKIALLVKNKITHEVARSQRSQRTGLAPLKRDSLLAAANDPFATSSETLDRQTQRKLELYQQMFWHLQTTPSYFARLFAKMGNNQDGASARKGHKSLEAITMVVFGYAQAQREEFLLLKLFQRSIEEELLYVPSVAAFVKGNFLFVKLLMQYGRGINQRRALQDIIGVQVNAIMDSRELNLSTDPVAIYKSLIAQEETRTGVVSSRPLDVDYAYAVSDPETNQTFIKHLIALRQATDSILKSLLASTHLMPYGVRLVARDLFRALRSRFPNESEAEMLRVAGHLVYYRFIQPAIIAPETFDIVSGVVPIQERQNLSEVAKLLNQVSVGRLFGQDQAYLMPMNNFLESSSARFATWIQDVMAVEDAEIHFRADEWIDAKSAQQPVVYISPNDIYSTHSTILDHIDVVAPDSNDPLRMIVVELGGVPIGGSAELTRARADEVPLTLTTRLRADDDPNAEGKLLFSQAKRKVIGILKVHSGNDLEQVLSQQVTEEDEITWSTIVEEELQDEQIQAGLQKRKLIIAQDDIRLMTFHQLKMSCLQNILNLRQQGLISKQDKYQTLLDSIALDIRSKHYRRVQRQNEITTMQATLTTLRQKQKYLQDQIKSYHVYIDQSMTSIQKKSKKRIILPWSLQGSHERSLERQGKRYKYGSYKYTAQTLYDKGILLSVDQYSPKQFDKVALTISSDQVGLFELKTEFGDQTLTTIEIKLEDLLEMQFAGRQTLEIGTVAKVNLNLLVHLINRKFYTS
ncbi:iqgap- protein [Microbotryomycetes sp. JL221]|nr:iqgap- protein [Microbotryomycetes sp. JL221]